MAVALMAALSLSRKRKPVCLAPSEAVLLEAHEMALREDWNRTVAKRKADKKLARLEHLHNARPA